jgi:hypothetical protein
VALRNLGSEYELRLEASQVKYSKEELAQMAYRMDHMVRGTARVNAQPAVSVNYVPVEYLSIAVATGKRFAVVTRYLALHIKQERIQTISTLYQWLQIEYYRLSNLP